MLRLDKLHKFILDFTNVFHCYYSCLARLLCVAYNIHSTQMSFYHFEFD